MTGRIPTYGMLIALTVCGTLLLLGQGTAQAQNTPAPAADAATSGIPAAGTDGAFNPGTLTGGISGAVAGAASALGGSSPAGSAVSAATGGAIGGDTTPNAQSAFCQGCSCENNEQTATQQVIRDEENLDRKKITKDFEDAQVYWVLDWYVLYVRKAWKLMTEQLITNGANQMAALGAMFDAKEQLDTQRLMQQRMAQAHRDYQVSTEMCVAGTMTEHMASTDRRAALAAHTLAKRSLDRQLGNNMSEGVDGPESDSDTRLDQVRNTYCDKNDNLATLDNLCKPGGQPNRINRDIDYARVMNDTPTLDLDVSDTTQTNDEQDVFALANYLYVNRPFSRPPTTVMATEEGQEEWLRMRAIMARHAVAENSFDSVMGLKAAMPSDYTDNAKFLGMVFQRLGLSADDAKKITGRESSGNGNTALNRPSQYALLQTLSHSMYQTPSFYVNLYDTPANIRRKDVAIQAIGLMLDRESFNSEIREEGVLSQILEANVARAQDRVINAGALRRGSAKPSQSK